MSDLDAILRQRGVVGLLDWVRLYGPPTEAGLAKVVRDSAILADLKREVGPDRYTKIATRWGVTAQTVRNIENNAKNIFKK